LDNKIEKELAALISLLDEPNEENFGSIKERISSYGIFAIPMLEDAWLHATEEENARRIEYLIDEIRFNDIYNSLENWAKFHNDDLLKAFFLISKFRYPDLDDEKYLVKIEKLKQDIWLEMNEELTALEKVKVLNHIFYDVHRFRGQLTNQTRINDYCLNEVLDNHRGSAITLGILYASLSQKLNIPVFGVDLPSHFIVAYMDDSRSLKDAKDYSREEVLFYIAVANKGSVFTHNEINTYLSQLKLEEKSEYFLPCSNIVIIQRLLNEMVSMYRIEKSDEKAELIIQLLKALD
jgi:regulator of sirC expression with transglutaminase-like and TPR domain